MLLIKFNLLNIKTMKKIIEQFLSNKKARKEKELKKISLLSLEIGVPWNGN
jgi:hypothetical protein